MIDDILKISDHKKWFLCDGLNQQELVKCAEHCAEQVGPTSFAKLTGLKVEQLRNMIPKQLHGDLQTFFSR